MNMSVNNEALQIYLAERGDPCKNLRKESPSPLDTVQDSDDPATKQDLQHMLDQLRQDTQDLLDAIEGKGGDMQALAEKLIDDQATMQNMVHQYNTRNPAKCNPDTVAQQFEHQFTPDIDSPSFPQTGGVPYSAKVALTKAGNFGEIMNLVAQIGNWEDFITNSYGLE